MNKFIPKSYKNGKIRKKSKFTKRKEIKHINLKNGNIGLKCLQSGQISSEVLESLRRSVNKRIKKIGKMIIYLQANKPLTKKSIGLRMGKGSGSIDSWVGVVKKGKILIELKNVPENIAWLALKSASLKLPINTKIIKNS